MEYAINTQGLVKSFGQTHAVDGVNLAIQRGHVFGLLGPNGAGKTTTVRLLATLLTPDAGNATVLGYDLIKDAAAIRTKVSLTGQFASVDEDLTGVENLVLLARLLGHSWRDAKRRAQALLQAFDLVAAGPRQASTYSGGMRRRLDIAASLIVTPEILFLDEPTTGLDPRSRNQVWDIVREIATEGTTVLLTTQYLEEADQLADRLAVIDHGRLIAEGTSRELKASVGQGVLKVTLQSSEQRQMALQLLSNNGLTDALNGDDPYSFALQVASDGESLRALSLLTANNIGVAEFALGAPSLDEVFFALTGKPAQVETQPEVAV